MKKTIFRWLARFVIRFAWYLNNKGGLYECPACLCTFESDREYRHLCERCEEHHEKWNKKAKKGLVSQGVSLDHVCEAETPKGKEGLHSNTGTQTVVNVLIGVPNQYAMPLNGICLMVEYGSKLLTAVCVKEAVPSEEDKEMDVWYRSEHIQILHLDAGQDQCRVLGVVTGEYFREEFCRRFNSLRDNEFGADFIAQLIEPYRIDVENAEYAS